MKTTNSAWAHFLRDEYTLLPDTEDRLMASSIDVDYGYRTTNIDSFDNVTSGTRAALIRAFAGPPDTGVPSASVQETVKQMCEAAMMAQAEVSDVNIRAPNLHNIPFDFSRLAAQGVTMPAQGSAPGAEAIHNRDGTGKTEAIANRDSTGKPDVFIATTEPHGIIELSVSRQAPGESSEEAAAAAGVEGAATEKKYPTVRLTKQQFLNLTGGLYEKTPWIAESVADFLFGVVGAGVAGRQVSVDLDEVPALLQATVDKGASKEQQLALLKAHPDLAGKLAVDTFHGQNAKAGGEGLTSDSQREQKSAGLDKCTPEEFARFQANNGVYVQRFGFPYILAVSGRSRQEILRNFEERVGNSAETEFAEALTQVHRIAGIRIEQMAKREGFIA